MNINQQYYRWQVQNRHFNGGHSSAAVHCFRKDVLWFNKHPHYTRNSLVRLSCSSFRLLCRFLVQVENLNPVYLSDLRFWDTPEINLRYNTSTEKNGIWCHFRYHNIWKKTVKHEKKSISFILGVSVWLVSLYQQPNANIVSMQTCIIEKASRYWYFWPL